MNRSVRSAGAFRFEHSSVQPLIWWSGVETNLSEQKTDIQCSTLSLASPPEPIDPGRVEVAYRDDRVRLPSRTPAVNSEPQTPDARGACRARGQCVTEQQRILCPSAAVCDYLCYESTATLLNAPRPNRSRLHICTTLVMVRTASFQENSKAVGEHLRILSALARRSSGSILGSLESQVGFAESRCMTAVETKTRQ